MQTLCTDFVNVFYDRLGKDRAFEAVDLEKARAHTLKKISM